MAERKTRFAPFGRANEQERIRIGRNAFAFLDAQAEVIGADLIVDTSKGWRRLDMLLAARQEDMYVLHLKRDGRAIVHSYSLKYNGRYVDAIRRWMVSVLSGWVLKFRAHKTHWLELRYEDFCAAPEKEIARILKFVGHDPVEQILQPRPHKPYIAIAGNRMRTSGSIIVNRDEKWRTGLPRKVRITFDLMLRRLNWLHGSRLWR